MIPLVTLEHPDGRVEHLPCISSENTEIQIMNRLQDLYLIPLYTIQLEKVNETTYTCRYATPPMRAEATRHPDLALCESERDAFQACNEVAYIVHLYVDTPRPAQYGFMVLRQTEEPRKWAVTWSTHEPVTWYDQLYDAFRSYEHIYDGFLYTEEAWACVEEAIRTAD